MNLDARHLKTEIEKILNEDALSPEELSNKTGVHRSTIYSILAASKATVQRATARRIAEGTGRSLRIDGDKVYFEEKPDADVITEDLPVDDEMQEVLDHISKIKDPRRRETILSIITMLSEMPPEKVKIIKAMIGMIE